MNGEIFQASCIVISVRKSLYNNCKIDFDPGKYIQSIEFLFKPKFLFGATKKANSVFEWFEICKKRGLKDIKFVVPTSPEYKHLQAFANATQCFIQCFWKNGKASCFFPRWEFDNEQKAWNVCYFEKYLTKTFYAKPTFENKTEDFKSVLWDIGKFALDLDFPYFSEVFNEAYEALCGSSNIELDNIPEQLPENFKAIYFAVNKADVFGGMGSWNDSPPYYAHYKGLDDEYHELSERLYVQLRHHLMFVANECWTEV